MAEPDYDALAAQARASVAKEPDYDALAEQARKKPSLGTATGLRAPYWYEQPAFTLGSYEAPSPLRMADSLPYVGGTIGGLLGGAGTGAAALETGPGAIPAGAAGAVKGAALGGAGGEAIAQLIRRGMGASVPQTSLGAAGQIAGQGAGQAAAEVLGQGGAMGLRAVGTRLMQSALKPTVALLEDFKTTGPKVAQTLLDEGVNVTDAGMRKLNTLFNATNEEIKKAVSGSAATVDKGTILNRLAPTYGQFGGLDVNAARQAITAEGEKLIEHPDLPGNVLTIPQAQKLKQDIYKEVGDSAYGQMSSATKEAKKALARGLKEEIAAEVPSIAALNARDTELMAAKGALERRTAILGNRDPIGFGMVGAAAGAAGSAYAAGTGHNETAAVLAPMTFLVGLMDRSPAVKSMLARGMWESAAKAAKVAPSLLRAAVAALATSNEDKGDQGGQQ